MLGYIQWDGGEYHHHKYYVATKELADEWMKNNKFDLVQEKEFVILDSLTEIASNLRKQALAKLTPEERQALGF